MKQALKRQMFDYSAFGLNFQSEIELPELLPSKAGASPVIVEFGTVPSDLEGAIDRGGIYAVKPGSFLLTMDGVGRYLVENGRRITVQPEPDAEEDDVRVFLLGSSFGALLHQRGVLALHASAVVVDGGAVLFTGLSGAGKSTTAAAFQRLGHRILADDITAVTLLDGRPMAQPGLVRLKLWRDSVKNLNHDPKTLKNVRRGTIHRFALPIKDFCSEAIPLRAVFALSHWNEDYFEHHLAEHSSSFNLLLRNTYRSRFLNGLKAHPKHFKVASAVSQQVPIHILCRPDHPFQVEELIELVLEQLK